MASSSLLGGHMEINHWVTRRTMTVKRLDACLTRLSLPIKDCSPDPYISYTKKKIHVQCVIHITLRMWTNSIKNISTKRVRELPHLPPRPTLLRANPMTLCGDDIDVQLKRNLLSPKPPSEGSTHGSGSGISNRGWGTTKEITLLFRLKTSIRVVLYH